MYFHIIASGSKGNATIVATNKTKILIDMGISLCRLEEGLAEINLQKDAISAGIFTHNHADHISGIKFFSPKMMYGLEGTLPSLCNVVYLNKTFVIGDIEITPFKTSHDAINPCGYKLVSGDESLVYMTDTGIFLEENLPLIQNPTYLIIESNHDISMLLQTNRPLELKNRIMSDHGHLCNEDSAFAASNIIGNNTKEVVLAHLSEEANTPEKAVSAYKEIFNEIGKSLESFKLSCANQWASLTGGNVDVH